MAMTKKDFIKIADAVIEHNDRARSGLLAPFTQAQLDAVAYGLKSVSPAFMQDRWLDYIKGKCGPSGGNVKKPVAKK